MVLASLGPEARERGVFAAIRSGRNVKEGLLMLNIDGDRLIKPQHAETFIKWLADKLQAYVAEGNWVVHNSDAKYCEHCVVLDPKDTFSF